MGYLIAKWNFFWIVLVVLTSVAWADRAPLVLSSENVTVEEPGQKAIIAHNGVEEILILGTDVKASKTTKVLEFTPFPSEPTVSLAPESFHKLEGLLKTHDMTYVKRYGSSPRTRSIGGSPSSPVELRFHKQFGPHDVIVIKIRDASYFIDWANTYFQKNGLPVREFSEDEVQMITDYVDRGFPFFVIDLVELSPETTSVEPLVYQFSTQHLYYPLKTSNLFSGSGSIELFLFTNDMLVFDWFDWYVKGEILKEEKISEVSPSYRWMSSNTASVTPAEMHHIAPVLSELLNESAFLRTFRYKGALRFTEDIWLKWPTFGQASIAPTIHITMGTEKARYELGDSFNLRFQVAQSCYMNILYTVIDDTIIFLLPNQNFPEVYLEKGRMYSLKHDFNMNLSFSPPAGFDVLTLFCSAEKVDLFDLATLKEGKYYIILPTQNEARKYLLEQIRQLQQVTWGGTSLFLPVAYDPVPVVPQSLGVLQAVWSTATVGQLASVTKPPTPQPTAFPTEPPTPQPTVSPTQPSTPQPTASPTEPPQATTPTETPTNFNVWGFFVAIVILLFIIISFQIRNKMRRP